MSFFDQKWLWEGCQREVGGCRREFGGCENRGGVQTLKGVDISWDDHVCLASSFGER